MDTLKRNSPELKSLIAEIETSISDMKTIRRNHRPAIENERYYTTEQVCETLHISKRGLQNYRDNGTIPFTKIGEKILYLESDINKILEQNYYSAKEY